MDIRGVYRGLTLRYTTIDVHCRDRTDECDRGIIRVRFSDYSYGLGLSAYGFPCEQHRQEQTSWRSNGSDSPYRRRRTGHSVVFARWRHCAPPHNRLGLHESASSNGRFAGLTLCPTFTQTDRQTTLHR